MNKRAQALSVHGQTIYLPYFCIVFFLIFSFALLSSRCNRRCFVFMHGIFTLRFVHKCARVRAQVSALILSATGE